MAQLIDDLEHAPEVVQGVVMPVRLGVAGGEIGEQGPGVLGGNAQAGGQGESVVEKGVSHGKSCRRKGALATRANSGTTAVRFPYQHAVVSRFGRARLPP